MTVQAGSIRPTYEASSSLKPAAQNCATPFQRIILKDVREQNDCTYVRTFMPHQNREQKVCLRFFLIFKKCNSVNFRTFSSTLRLSAKVRMHFQN
jgi:hypothetical protein